MAATKGPTLILKSGSTAIAALRSKTVTINNNPIDVTTDDDVNLAGQTFRTYIAGVTDVNISASGITKTPTEARALRTACLNGTVAAYEVEFPGGDTIGGQMFVASFEDTGSYDGAVEFSITLQAAGAMTYTNSA